MALPHSDFADHRVLRGNPRDWYDVYRDTFDYLYYNEPTSYLNITVHCHFGGRPLIAETAGLGAADIALLEIVEGKMDYEILEEKAAGNGEHTTSGRKKKKS